MVLNALQKLIYMGNFYLINLYNLFLQRAGLP